MDLIFVPYTEIGTLCFNASNDSAIKVFGTPISQSMYGYPQKTSIHMIMDFSYSFKREFRV